jgi:hypothetical protein
LVLSKDEAGDGGCHKRSLKEGERLGEDKTKPHKKAAKAEHTGKTSESRGEISKDKEGGWNR